MKPLSQRPRVDRMEVENSLGAQSISFVRERIELVLQLWLRS
jgi:hypothetical protein